MGLFSNLAIRAWNTVSKLLNFFGRLSDARSRRISQDKERLLYIAEKQDIDIRSTPEFEAIERQEEEINKLKQLAENVPEGYNPMHYFQLLIRLLATLNRTEESLDLNQLYTFKYIARTPRWYDLHPVILVTKIDGVHFEGINFHWKDAASYVESPYRKYRFDRMQSKFYRIQPNELDYVLKIPTFYPIKITSK